jgi:hypothetical protein
VDFADRQKISSFRREHTSKILVVIRVPQSECAVSAPQPHVSNDSACQQQIVYGTLRLWRYVNSFQPLGADATAAFNVSTLAVRRKIYPSSIAENGCQISGQAIVV